MRSLRTRECSQVAYGQWNVVQGVMNQHTLHVQYCSILTWLEDICLYNVGVALYMLECCVFLCCFRWRPSPASQGSPSGSSHNSDSEAGGKASSRRGSGDKPAAAAHVPIWERVQAPGASSREVVNKVAVTSSPKVYQPLQPKTFSPTLGSLNSLSGSNTCPGLVHRAVVFCHGGWHTCDMYMRMCAVGMSIPRVHISLLS